MRPAGSNGQSTIFHEVHCPSALRHLDAVTWVCAAGFRFGQRTARIRSLQSVAAFFGVGVAFIFHPLNWQKKRGPGCPHFHVPPGPWGAACAQSATRVAVSLSASHDSPKTQQDQDSHENRKCHRNLDAVGVQRVAGRDQRAACRKRGKVRYRNGMEVAHHVLQTKSRLKNRFPAPSFHYARTVSSTVVTRPVR
jgi:hypothetical protein